VDSLIRKFFYSSKS